MMMTSSVKAQLVYAGKQVQGMVYKDLTANGNVAVITGVKVLWSGAVVGLEFVFGGQSAGMVKGSKNDNIYEEVLNLAQGDYIVEIFGRHSEVVNCVGIRTKRGYNKIWGDPMVGEPFRFTQPDSYVKAVKLGVGLFLGTLEPVYELEMFLGARVVNLIQHAKCTDKVGKTHSDTIDFDDGDFVNNKFNYFIKSIKVFHDGNFVYGFQTFYDMDGTTKSPGMHVSMGNNLKQEVVSLSEGEHIVKIFVKAGDCVDRLVFFTDKGRVFHFGGFGGNGYILQPPQGHHFVAFSGGNGGRLDTFSAQYDEIY
jgi:hypothetical protein